MLAFSRKLRFNTPKAVNLNVNQKRNLNIHEYQSQKLLKDFGLNCVKGTVATSAEEAEKVAQTYYAFSDDVDVVVKAQTLAGGRGKGVFDTGFKGGVHMCTSAQEVKDIAEKMLGNRLITVQSGSEGKPVNCVYICERRYIRREVYLAVMMDRSSNGPVIIGSAVGGVNIETIAHETPDAIIKEVVDVKTGVTQEQALRIATKLGFKRGKILHDCANQVRLLYDLFWQNDCTLVEINPLVETSNGECLIMDAKINIDDNALFRHPELAALRDETQEDPRDIEALKHDLNYIGLDGNIACLVNGAGLAMATMDIIKLHGGSPANFLDVGGGASEAQVMAAFKIITSDPNVKSILVNIFGGIMRCDVIALGIVNAAKTLGLKIPVVIRLQGTNAEKGQQIIEASGFRLIGTDDLDEAAEQAVKIAEIVDSAAAAHLNVKFEIPI